ncbi:hypothetical protein [Streptomyces sp. NPDC001851]|uniref:hypothetical protein n=1 Tax=Streptomyces sp. NPDC001851 TaxID=3154529 RepID=UPI003316913D
MLRSGTVGIAAKAGRRAPLRRGGGVVRSVVHQKGRGEGRAQEHGGDDGQAGVDTGGEGVADRGGHVQQDHRLRTLTLVNATTPAAPALLNTLWALYLLRSLSMGPTAFGVTLGVGALGAAAGALTAPALVRWYGPGPMMLVALAVTPLTQIPLLLTSPGLAWQIAISAALYLQLACAAAAGTTQRSIRQVVTADGMQARLQAVST